MRTLTFESIHSTNDYAKTIATNPQELKEDTVIIANHQTAGKGQYGREWYSQSSGGLYYTYLHFFHESLNLTPYFTVKVGKITAMVLTEQLTQAKASLKVNVEWPNDLIVNQKKIGGILVEKKGGVQGPQFVVVGIGLNLNQSCFPQELQAIATSVYLETGKNLVKKQVADALTQSLQNCFKGLYTVS